MVIVFISATMPRCSPGVCDRPVCRLSKTLKARYPAKKTMGKPNSSAQTRAGKQHLPSQAAPMLDDEQTIEHAGGEQGGFLFVGEHRQHHTGIESYEQPEALASAPPLRVQIKEQAAQIQGQSEGLVDGDECPDYPFVLSPAQGEEQARQHPNSEGSCQLPANLEHQRHPYAEERERNDVIRNRILSPNS